MTTISDKPPLDGAMADADATKFGLDAGAFSYHMTAKNMRKMIDWPIIQPTGVKATDTAALAAAYAALPTSGGTIWIDDGELVLGNSGVGNNFISFAKPVMLRGKRGANAIITCDSMYSINWGGYPAVVSAGVAFSGINAGESVLQSPNLALAQDDWIVIFSQNSLNAFVDPHLASSGNEYPAELHRVVRVNGSNVILDSPVIDSMTTNPKIIKLTMLRNCGLCDIKFKATNVTGGSTQYAQFNVSNTLNWRTENLTAEQGGGGYFTLDYSHDVHIANFSGERQQNANRNYGIVAGTVNGFRFCDSTWHENRHVFTTGTDSVGNDRYGTPRNVVIENVTQHCGGDTAENDFACFDTHSEGYEVEFRKCRVFASSQQKVIGFNSRSRKTKFIDCEFHGTEDSNTSIAFRDIGTGMVVKGGFVRNAWYGVGKLPGVYGGVFDDITVDGTHFDNARSACVYQTSGNNVTVKNITTERSGWQNNAGTPFIPRTLIHIEDGIGHKIYSNELNKQSNGASSNDYSISLLTGAPSPHWYDLVDFDGNKCRGYGTGKLGIRGAIGDPNGTSITEAESFQTEYATDYGNRTDA